MRQKHDWIRLKNEFVTGKWPTVSAFFQAQNIVDNSRNRLNSRGWLESRRLYWEEIAQRSKEKLVESEADIRLRQSALARQLQLKGLKELQNLPVEDVDSARKLVVSGMEQERISLGITEKEDTQNLTQVNVNLPRTKFDEIIEGLDFEGLLRLLAEVRRERVRRKRLSEEIVPER